MSRIAFLFPGQGAQYIGMGKDLYEKEEMVKKTFEEASEALGKDMAKLCFESEEINKTEYTQPAILTLSVAIMRCLEREGIRPEMTAGLSLGEYAALVTSGVIDFKEAVALVRKRGKYMQESIPDGEWRMAAIVGLENEIVESVCEEASGFVKCANYNCPGQLVIAGEKLAVETSCEKLKELGAKRAILLNVMAPFHTSKLELAKVNLGKELEKITFSPFTVPVIKNIDGKPYEAGDDVKGILANHVVSPVYWEKSMRFLLESGMDTFLEIGPGKTLAGFMKKIAKDVKVLSIGDCDSFGKLKEVL